MDNPEGATVRFAAPSGNTRAEMREWLKSSDHGKALYAYGDCLLVWANEGDLFRPALPAADASPLGAVAWRPMPAPNDVDILVLRTDGRLEYIEADDNDYAWSTPEHYARTPTGQGITCPSAWMLADGLRIPPTHAAQLAAALKLPEVAAMREAANQARLAIAGLVSVASAERKLDNALSALEARHDPA